MFLTCCECNHTNPKKSLRAVPCPRQSGRVRKGEDMRTNRNQTDCRRCAFCCVATLLLVTAGACSREAKPTAVRIMPAGKEFSGFLSDYAKLKPNPDFEN